MVAKEVRDSALDDYVARVLGAAREGGAEFVVISGFCEGELIRTSSDVDIICRDDAALRCLLRAALNVAKEQRFSTCLGLVSLRERADGFQLVFFSRSSGLVHMLDASVCLRAENLVWFDADAFFSLAQVGVDASEFVRALKRLNSFKEAWPDLPKTYYSLRSQRIGLGARAVSYASKFLRLVSTYLRPRAGVFAAFMGIDGSGKSSAVLAFDASLDRERTVLAVQTFHWRPRVSFSRSKTAGHQQGGVLPHEGRSRSACISVGKLVYLLLSFVAGYLTSVRPVLTRGAIVLGDRYYHDMLLDPKRYRYGGPMWLARLVARAIPKPDLFIVLDLPAEVAIGRKPEVPLEEARRLRSRYLNFAAQQVNAYVLDASQPTEAVVAQAQEIVLRLLEVRTRLRLGHNGDLAGHGAIESFLAASLGLSPTEGKDGNKFCWLRLTDGRGYLFPANSSQSFARGLALWRPQRAVSKAAAAALCVLGKAGLATRALRSGSFGSDGSCPGSILDYLRATFGRDDLEFGISLGNPGPRRKPVIQIVSRAGEFLGYAKVGWSSPSRALVCREVEALNALNGHSLPFCVPTVLHTADWHGRFVCVQSAPPGPARKAPCEMNVQHVRALEALAKVGLCRKRLEDSPYWARLLERREQVTSPYWRHLLDCGIERVETALDGQKIPWHLCHGDLAPWNTVQVQGRLLLFDWECALDEAPAGYDLFHFLVQTLSLLKRRPPGEIRRAVVTQRGGSVVAEYWEGVGVSDGMIPGLFVLYLLDQMSWYAQQEPESFQKLRRYGTLINLCLVD